jgi:glycerophosphoryl diester phosphodiesterase
VPVVFHDLTTERWNGQQRPLNTCTLADLRTLNIGGERIATLNEVCAFAREHGCTLNIELKRNDPDPTLVRQTVQLLRTYNLCPTTILSSFHARVLHNARRVAPTVPRGYIMGLRTARPDIRLREMWPFLSLKRVQATSWHPNGQLPLLRWTIPLARRAGYAVYVWTVDDPAAMRTVAGWGASGIMTNRPDVGRQSVQQHRR